MKKIVVAVIVTLALQEVSIFADDRLVEFAQFKGIGHYELVRLKDRRPVLTTNDSRQIQPEHRGVTANGTLPGKVRISEGHAIRIDVIAAHESTNSLAPPIDLSFLASVNNGDLCGLDVARNALTCEQITSLGRFSNLHELHAVVDTTCNVPKCLDDLQKLDVLRLLFLPDGTKVDVDGWVNAIAKKKSLRGLLLGGLPLADRHFKTLSSLKHLERIDCAFAKMRFTDDGLMLFSSFGALREANIQGSEVLTDRSLSPFFGMKRIERIALTGRFSAAEVKRLQDALPRAELSIEFP